MKSKDLNYSAVYMYHSNRKILMPNQDCLLKPWNFFTSTLQIDMLTEAYAHHTKTQSTHQVNKKEHITKLVYVVSMPIEHACIQHGRDCESTCELQQSTDMLANIVYRLRGVVLVFPGWFCTSVNHMLHTRIPRY